jgi:hypothetical protein
MVAVVVAVERKKLRLSAIDMCNIYPSICIYLNMFKGKPAGCGLVFKKD